jgi:hypothetical protein
MFLVNEEVTEYQTPRLFVDNNEHASRGSSDRDPTVVPDTVIGRLENSVAFSQLSLRGLGNACRKH